jgi:ribonuclease P protein component
VTARPESATSQRFPRLYRIRKRSEFLALQRAGRRQSAPHFIVIIRCRNEPPARLGITTSRKVGSAPVRNRVRRLVREYFRRHRTRLLAPADVLVIARASAAGVDYKTVERELSRALGIKNAD